MRGRGQERGKHGGRERQSEREGGERVRARARKIEREREIVQDGLHVSTVRFTLIKSASHMQSSLSGSFFSQQVKRADYSKMDPV